LLLTTGGGHIGGKLVLILFESVTLEDRIIAFLVIFEGDDHSASHSVLAFHLGEFVIEDLALVVVDYARTRRHDQSQWCVASDGGTRSASE
jgi:hypothetical protein